MKANWDYQEVQDLEAQSNFKIVSEYTNNKFCSFLQKCNNDKKCEKEVSDPQNYDNPLLGEIGYGNQELKITNLQLIILIEYNQLASFSGSQEYQWSSLTTEQKERQIIYFFVKSITISIIFNCSFLDLRARSAYINFEKDGLLSSISYMNSLRLSTINNEYYGGPFDCTKVNGQYKEYKFNNVNQFHGFYKKDMNNISCIKPSTGDCQCPYYNQKRLFPIEWRCRPWYEGGAKNFISFTNPYIDAYYNIVMTTITFRLINSQNEEDIYKYAPNNDNLNAVIGIDLDLYRLQTKFMESSTSNQYSYMVAPMTPKENEEDIYYQYNVLTHPLMKQLEFEGSLNKEEEIKEYIQQLGDILTNKSIRYSGCNFQKRNRYSKIYNIYKNQTKFLTYITEVKVCYGDLNTQQSMIVGYLVNSFNSDSYLTILEDVKDNTRQVMRNWMIFTLAILVFTFTVLNYIIYQFLKLNFEKPISILTSFIKEAKTTDIYQLWRMIETGEIKTQFELKNLIQAIHQVVLRVQSVMDKQQAAYIENSNQDHTKVYLEALTNFQIFEHKTGMAICYNNLSNECFQNNKICEGIIYSQKCLIISEQMYKEIIQQYPIGEGEEEKQFNICLDPSLQGFMKLHACRKYSLAKALINYVKLQKQQKINEDFQEVWERIINQSELKLEEQQNILQNTLSIQLISDGGIQSNQFIKAKRDKRIPKFTFIKDCEKSVTQSQCTRLQFFSSKKYENQREIYSLGDTCDQENPPQMINDPKFLLSQALDLLYDSKNIMQKLVSSHRLYSNSKTVFGLTLQILILNEISKGQNLMKNRDILIKEILKMMKEELMILENTLKFQEYSKHVQIPLSVLKTKYYLIKGKYYLKQSNSKKSLSNFLKGLNYSFNERKVTQSDDNKFPYDVVDSYSCLKGIFKISSENLIFENSSLEFFLKNDLEILKSQNNKQTNLHFEEMFFHKGSLKTRATIIQPHLSNIRKLSSFFIKRKDS